MLAPRAWGIAALFGNDHAILYAAPLSILGGGSNDARPNSGNQAGQTDCVRKKSGDEQKQPTGRHKQPIKHSMRRQTTLCNLLLETSKSLHTLKSQHNRTKLRSTQYQQQGRYNPD